MNDFQKFVSPQPNDPYGEIRVNPIEGHKKEKQPYADLPPPQTSLKPLAGLMYALKKPLDAFFESDADTFLLENPQHLLDAVLDFKNLLEKLIDNDLSHDSDFAGQLSSSWHTLCSDCDFLLSHASPLPDYAEKTHLFIEALNHYPENQDHSLGYYFTASAGENWTPVPFMDMLQTLHKEGKSAPENATLIQWVVTLSTILEEH